MVKNVENGTFVQNVPWFHTRVHVHVHPYALPSIFQAYFFSVHLFHQILLPIEL
jgi:hypothetical protein